MWRRWPDVDPVVRAAETGSGRSLSLVAWLVLLPLAWVPGFAEATGLSSGELAIVAGLHCLELLALCGPWSRRLPDEHTFVRLTYGGVPFFNSALMCALVVFSEDPGSYWWAFLLLYATVMARAFRPSTVLVALCAAAPLATAGVFLSLGAAAKAVRPVFLIAASAPVLYAILATRIERTRAWEKAARLRQLEEARVREEEARVELLARTGRELEAAIDCASAAVARARAASSPEEAAGPAAEVVALVRDAMHELRAAVWSIDPRGVRWEVVESHLRRIAAERAAPGACAFEASVEAARNIAPEARLQLLRTLRAAVGPGPTRVSIRGEGDRLLVEVDGPAGSVRRHVALAGPHDHGMSEARHAG